jgi:hypothetical protein
MSWWTNAHLAVRVVEDDRSPVERLKADDSVDMSTRKCSVEHTRGWIGQVQAAELEPGHLPLSNRYRATAHIGISICPVIGAWQQIGVCRREGAAKRNVDAARSATAQ